MSAERNFTVKGRINCDYAPEGTPTTLQLANIEVQLWRKNSFNATFLGKGITNSAGEYIITFELESPNTIIENGKINNVYLKVFYKDKLILDETATHTL